MILLKEKYIVDDNGKKTSVILAKKDFDRLMDYVDELEDIAAYDRAKQLKGEPTPWKELKR